MSAPDYPAGTVAKATVRGVPDVRVFRYHEGRSLRWDSAERVDDAIVHGDDDVTDVRPLIVLDPTPLYEDGKTHVSPSEFARTLRLLADADGSTYRARIVRRAADQIEAQTKPPRIPEPGLWGVVSVENRHGLTDYWTRGYGGWFSDAGHTLDWASLVDPELVRDGIEDAS